MSSKRKSVRAGRPRLFFMMLSFELRGYVKPYLIAGACYLFSLASAAVSILYIPALKTAAYAILYASVMAIFAVTAAVPIRRTFLDITKKPLFDGITPSPRPSELAAAKLTPILMFSVLSASLHAAADATVTHLSALTYDGYGKTLVSVSVLMLSLVFYLSAVVLTSVADYRPDPKAKPKKLRRRVTMDGILLYALGLTVLVFVMLCLSAVPFGSDALADLSGTGLNPDTSLSLSLIYLAVSLLRAVYLYFILKRRLCRALKLH